MLFRLIHSLSRSILHKATLESYQVAKRNMNPLPKDHQFTHPELNYEADPNFQPTIKVSVFFRKKDGISHEDFFKHWQTVHADLAVATQAFQHNILRYVQVLSSSLVTIKKE